MCFGGDDGSNEAERARNDEKKRQDRIRLGTNNINAIFDGGQSWEQVAPTQTSFNLDSGEYYGADGNRLKGRIGDFNSEVVLKKGAAKPGQFTDDFYKGRKQAYLDYATPQLQDQYKDAQKQLIFSLDRSGNLDSTARGEKTGELQKLYDIQQQQVADRALSSETSARNSVEDARSNLITMLNATGDAEGAAKSALARSQALSAPEEYSPLSQLFVDFTNGLGVQAAQERSYNAGGPAPRYNTGLFGNAGRVSISN
jgi:hypothetical protein